MTQIGIDLGTTNSLIAVFEDDNPRLISNANGSYLTPSVVSLDDNGEVLVGQAAKDRLVSHPKSSVSSFKRLMGTKTGTLLGTKNFRPEELSALVLRSLKQDAEAELGGTISESVISVPAYFNDQQRKATLDAGALAGLKVSRLVNEPTAAALAYGLQSKTEGKYLVFDLGGGTFDVSILDKYDDILEIRSTTGDTRLGGDDFTAVIEQIIRRKSDFGPKALRPEQLAQLRRQADEVKHNLSINAETEFNLIFENGTFRGSLSRREFEIECATLLQRLRIPTERAVRDSGIDPNDFTAIVMVGGATRMQMVRSLVARMFGKLPLVTVDPDTTVALGAATQSGLIARSGALKDVVMTDICPYTLGIATVDDPGASEMRLHVDAIIERNAVIPISRSTIVQTIRNRQKQLELQVYQGENLRPENNVHLGSIDITVPPNKAGMERVEVVFTYDINGVLQVEATVLSTKKRYAKIFQNNTGLSEAELETRFKALDKIKLQPREQAENKSVIARAERLFEEHRGVSREEIKEILISFEREILDQKLRNPEICRKHYSRLLDAYETGPLGQN